MIKTPNSEFTADFPDSNSCSLSGVVYFPADNIDNLPEALHLLLHCASIARSAEVDIVPNVHGRLQAPAKQCGESSREFQG
jgi:hypothetical protein